MQELRLATFRAPLERVIVGITLVAICLALISRLRS
jgi:hypothetical protein